MKKIGYRKEGGFTLIELLIAMAISLVVIGGIFMTFQSQQDSYVVQEQVSQMQQNARAAMYLLTRDIQMAGYYSNFDGATTTMDWDDLDGDTELIRPLIYGRTNVGGNDTITIVKAGDKGRPLAAGEGTSANVLTLNTRDLDPTPGDGVDDLVTTNGSTTYGLLAKQDLTSAVFFPVTNNSGSIALPLTHTENYTQNDLIFKADVIIYRITNNALVRRNLADANGYQVVADNIDGLQFRYLIADGSPGGSWTADPAGREADVRSVEISILARTPNMNKGHTDTQTYTLCNRVAGPFNDGFRRRLLTSIVKTRNIGL